VNAAKHAHMSKWQEDEIKIGKKDINLLIFNAVLMQIKYMDLSNTCIRRE